MMRKNPQVVDSVTRAQQAENACRAATREAHEVIQCLKELNRILLGLLEQIQAQLRVVPDEVARQVLALEPVVREAVDSTVVAALEGISVAVGQRELQRHVPDSELDPDVSFGAVLACSRCGCRVTNPIPADPSSSRTPRKGNVSICVSCSGVSVFDLNDRHELFLRCPTKAEERDLSANPDVQRKILDAKLHRTIRPPR